MEKNWNFGIDTTKGDDFGDHGIETFSTSSDGAEKYKKLVREIIQNSIDARNDKIKGPVIVKFDLLEMSKNELPSFDGLKEHINGTLNHCERLNKKNNAYHNSHREIKILENDTLTILKISDYNTKGILGSKKAQPSNNNWYSLVYNEGDSVKSSADALGSHGLGKGAAFAISNLNTVFYNTYDINGVKAMQGVTRQYVSYVNGIKKNYKGYYCKYDKEDIYPFYDNEIIEQGKIFERNEFGTDVIIVEPDISLFTKETIAWYIIESVISNFYIALTNGDLEVKINNKEIKASNVDKVFRELKGYYEKENETKTDSLIATDQYIMSILNGEKVEEELDKYGTIKLWLYKDINTKWKRVAIFRKNGMFIKHLEVKSADQKFAGVVIVTGTEGGEFLKAIEDPNHLDFDPSRPTDEKYGDTPEKQKRLNKFYDWIREKAKVFAKVSSDDKITLSGMEDYIQMPSKEQRVYKPKSIEAKIITPKNPKSNYEKIGKKTSVVLKEDEDGEDRKEGKKIKEPSGGEVKKEIAVEDVKGKTKRIIYTYNATFNLGPATKFNGNVATIIFKITESNHKFNMKLVAIDEDGKENGLLPNIVEAFSESDNKLLKSNGHIVYDLPCVGITKIRLKFTNNLKSVIKPIIYWEEEKIICE